MDHAPTFAHARRVLLVTSAAALLGGMFTPAAVAFDAIPPMQPIHQEITRAALGGGAIMAEEALNRVVDAVRGSDLHLFDVNRHVDNAATPAGVCTRWKDGIDRWFAEAAALAGQDRVAALERFGWVAHAIQDFYAHSNYVELSLAGPVPPVEAILLGQCGPLPSAIQTGFFDLRYGVDGCPPLIGGPPAPPAPFGYCHAQLNKDDPGRPNFAQARGFAVAATKAAWEELHRRLVAAAGPGKAADGECLFLKLAWGETRRCSSAP